MGLSAPNQVRIKVIKRPENCGCVRNKGVLPTSNGVQKYAQTNDFSGKGFARNESKTKQFSVQVHSGLHQHGQLLINALNTAKKGIYFSVVNSS